jgi:hypothetical protein
MNIDDWYRTNDGQWRLRAPRKGSEHMLETEGERLHWVFHGDQVDPLEEQIKNHNAIIKAARRAAALDKTTPKVGVVARGGDITPGDPLGEPCRRGGCDRPSSS